MYNLSKDPHQLSNIAHSIDPQILMAQNKRLVELSICQGPSCRSAEPYPPRKHKWYDEIPPKHTEQKSIQNDATLYWRPIKQPNNIL